MNCLKAFLVLTALCTINTLLAAGAVGIGKHDAPGMGNPVLPGYFADPTVRKFGDTFYLYTTTDGTSGGTGPSQVWVSKDFVNWTNLSMEWPSSKWIWAPDVAQDEDGLYYFYYSQPCQIHAAVSETPVGPWKSMAPNPDPNADGMIIPNQYLPPVITLDWQIFDDDDGKRYGMFCTWAIYKGHGCGFVEVGRDMMPIDSNKWMVPNTQLKDIFEAPYMLKKDGVYYLMYSSGSCHDHTYRVQYATATDIKGPYVCGEVNNPILSVNQDQTIHGPGHHSMLQMGDDYFIVYHRHDIPNSNGGMHRQIAVDKLEFGPNNTIKKVVPTHKGIGYLGENSNPFPNLSFMKPVKASSYYNEISKPAFAVDDNNATLWKARDNTFPQSLEVDLGKVQPVKRTWTQFQYPNWYYQYKIEYSVDGQDWELFSDKSNNQLCGSPMVDFGDVKARFLRLTVTGLEKTGMYAAVWNFKAFEGAKEDPPQLLVHLEADDLVEGPLKCWPNNKGMVGGAYTSAGSIDVKIVDGRKAVVFGKDAVLELDGAAPDRLLKNNIYTLAYWTKRSGKKWHYVAMTADGRSYKTYLNGQLQQESKKPGRQIIDALKLQVPEVVQGDAISSLRIYGRTLHISEIKYLMEKPYKKPADPTPAPKGLLVDLDASELKMGVLGEWKNKGLCGKAFVAQNTPPTVEIVAGIKAVTFKGSDLLKSTFPTPKTLHGNSNYTVTVWAYNPVVQDAEFMVSWSLDDGLSATSAKLGYGKHPVFGATGHFGWADLNYKTVPAAGQWHHIAATFDGSVEKIYVDGRLDNQEENMLQVRGANEIFLGRGHNAPEFFSGSLASIQIYDRCLARQEIADFAAQKPSSDVLIAFDTGNLDYGSIKMLKNNGSLDGQFQTISQVAPTVDDVHGRIALIFDGNEQMLLNKGAYGIDNYSIEAFLNRPRLKDKWHHVVFTSEGDMYVNGGAVAGSSDLPLRLLNKGPELVLGSGFKGAVAKLALYNRVLTKEDIDDLYVVTTSDLKAPDPGQFENIPHLITVEGVGMSAREASDASGKVQYYFEEVSNNSGGASSGWISSNVYENWGLKADTEYAYTVRVRDYHGNVSKASPVQKLVTDSSLFTTYYDGFSKSHDYLSDGTEGSIWDGLVTKGQRNMKVTKAKAEGGRLRIEATGAILDQPSGGPFLYKVIKGDFVAETKVSGFQGWAQRKPPGLLEPALMIRFANDEDAGPGHEKDNVRSGIFPYWNCGNLWTSLDGKGRPQGHNQSGYSADLYLQIQRSGEKIYLRTSPDGKQWKPLPNTPVHRRDMSSLPLQVGLTQSIADADKTGWVDFDWFKVIVKKDGDYND